MAHPRTPSGIASTPSTTAPAASSGRHRLRSVSRGADRPDSVVDITGLLPPGATWLPAPPHTLPALPGRPPMVGYLVLVPADQLPAFTRQPAPVQAASAPDAPAPHPAGDPADTEDDRTPFIRIDPDRRSAEVDGRTLDLTYLEFELLSHLVAHPHRVHTRDQLVSTVWGYGHVGDGRTVDVHIARLRRKLGTEHRRVIQTVRRVGYRYVPPAER